MVKSFKYLLSVLLLSFIGLTASAQDPKTTYNISDDGYAIVPIPFGFPYYGRVFTHSIMFDNGVVSFYDPVTEAMRLGGQNFNAQPLSNNIGSNFHYSIMPLWSDLRNFSGSYYTQTDSQTYLRYTWENISQWGHPDRLNSFDLEIRPTGFIGVNYTKINISGYPITVGTVGNAELGEWQQHYYKPPTDTATLSSIQNWRMSGTEGADCSNPLVSQYCPGYQEAYFTQQCSINATYSPACPGYAAANFTLQCSANVFYDSACPGYATAYYDQQCGLDSLYHTGCPGYEDAYFTQQCDLDPLYNATCKGYEDAYYVQQCTLDPLYDSGCTGYTEAFALKMVLNKKPEEPTTVVEAVVVLQEQPEATPVAVSSPADVTAAVQLVSTATEVSNVSSASPTQSTTTTSTTPNSEKKAAPRTTRQQLAERRLAAAREAKTEQQNNTAAQMDSAASMEQQVELQNVVLGVMGFVPGFDAYGASFIPDGVGYKPFTIYENQNTVDNTRMLRGLSGASDRVHKQMIDSQYK